MRKESILTGVIGLFVGVMIAGFTASIAVNAGNTSLMQMMGINSAKTLPIQSHDEMSASAMADQLKGKTGDDFDKAFIEMMIPHDEGMVAVAQLAPAQAKHDEVKKLAQDIVTTQNNQINDMKLWQTNWGYVGMSSHDMNHMMHGSH